MSNLIKCTGKITNTEDGRFGLICRRTLAKQIDSNTIELKCPICKTKKIIRLSKEKR